MKKSSWILTIAALLAVFVLASPAAAASLKTKVAVLDFQLHGEHENEDMGKIFAEWLITALVNQGRLEVIERRLLEKVLSEQKIGATGLVDEQYASRLGKMLGARAIVSGALMKFQNVIEANARIIDVESGAVIAAEIVRSSSVTKLEDLVSQMAEKIIRDFPVEGYIVKRTEAGVLIDVGRLNGARKGMRFSVYKEGLPIKHPKTGEVLDVERIETGMVEIRSLNEKTADAVIVKETSADSIQYGQMVKSMKEVAAGTISRTDPGSTTPMRSSSMASSAQDIAAAEAIIEELGRLKKLGDKNWAYKKKEAARALKVLSKKYRRSPDLSIAYAKYFIALESLPEADSHLSRAISYGANATEVYMFQGDTYVEASARRASNAKYAIKAYEKAAGSTTNKDLQASLYLKIGNIWADILTSPGKAKDYWKKAAAAQPDGEHARQASERMALAK